jgi:hypothetical protein
MLTLIHFSSTVFMLAIIWFVQLVHYPQFKYVDATQIETLHEDNQKKTTYIVLPTMFLELITAILLVYFNPTPFFYANLGMLIAIWLSTFFIQVPLHGQLLTQLNVDVINKLVLTNWLRTALWSARSIGLFYYLKRYIL